jgi:hypothetical protein
MLLQFVPLLLTPLLYALFTKAAAFLFRRTQLSWLHAFLFGLLVVVVAGAGTVLKLASGFPLPMVASLLLGLAVPLLLGGWYLGLRARSVEGSALGFKGGLLLSLVAYGLVFAIGVVAAVLLPLLSQHATKA